MARTGPETDQAPMSEKGHSRHFDGLRITSVVLPEADIVTAGRHVSKVPKSDIDVTTIRLSYGDRKLKQSTVRFVPGRPQPSSVIFDD